MRSRTGTVRARFACSVATTSAGRSLVERCKPGTRLWETRDGDDVTRIVAGVLRRLWKPPRDGHPFRLLADAAAEWAEELPRGWEELGRPYEESFLEEAVAFLREAGPAQGEQVVLHQDLHGGNVLQAQREPWLAIDPKPLVGEREFDTASFLRDRRWELRKRPRPACGCGAGSTSSPASSTSTATACAAGASRTRSPGACPASPTRIETWPRAPAGSPRPSQVRWTFGPGADYDQ